MIRVLLPAHLRALANIQREVTFQVEGEASIDTVLSLLEAQYPMLRGTIRDHTTHERRPFVRFFACGLDLSLEPQNAPLPAAVATGEEPLRVVGAMAGG